MASKYGSHILGIDSDYDTVQRQMEEGRNVIIGDATDSVFWDNLRSGNVKLVLLTM
jgi:Trk K+ transport system NAD-binding subunit